jgi:CheY-like chemotaxis protein/type II secretory pathway pseudopilin PulG
MAEQPTPVLPLVANKIGATMSSSSSNGVSQQPQNWPMPPRLFTNISQAQQQQQQQQSLEKSKVSNESIQQQQRMFGLVNEAGTNLSHVPTNLVAPGQSFTFQRARFAISGAELNQVLAQHADAGHASSVMSSVLNRPGMNPVYRPDFFGPNILPNGGVSSLGSTQGTATTAGAPSIGAPGAGPLRFPLPGVGGYVPNFASVIAQRMPKASSVGSPYQQQSWGEFVSTPPGLLSHQLYQAYSPAAAAGMWPQQQQQQHFPQQDMYQYAYMQQSQQQQQHQQQQQQQHLLQHQQQLQQRRGHKRAMGVVSSSTSVTTTVLTDDDAMKKKRKKRDPTLPTPARFAWNFYFRDQYTKIRNSEPSEHTNVQKAFTDIGFDLGKKWKSLSKEEKEPYVKMAAQDKERYEREMQSRFSTTSKVGGGATPSSSSAGGYSSDDDEEEKVGIVLHEIAVEDTRPESEKTSDPTEGELVADVLIVDDDEVFLKIIRHKLVFGQKNPPRIVTVTSASDAKRMLVDENKKFGTVLLDKDLGEGQEDGISSLAVIRESGYQGVIVGVTGSTDDQTRSQFTSSGANETFIKGASNFYEDLLSLVRLHSKNVERMEKEEQGDSVAAAEVTPAFTVS